MAADRANKCRKNLVASCETRIRDQLNEDTWAMFPETLSPSVRDLQDGFAAMVVLVLSFPRPDNAHGWYVG